MTTARTVRLASRAWEDQFNVARWLGSEKGQSFFDTMWRTNENIRALGGRKSIQVSEYKSLREQAYQNLVHGMVRARTIFVSAHMTSLAEQTKVQFGEVPLVRDQIPGDSGWLWLEQPFMHMDIWGREFNIRAFQWITTALGVSVALWSDHSVRDYFYDDYIDVPDARHRRELFDAGYSLYDFFTLRFGETAKNTVTGDQIKAELVNALMRSPIGDEWDGYTEEDRAQRIEEIRNMSEEELEAFYSVNELPPLVQVIWALCGETVIKPTRPTKPSWKRVARSLHRFKSMTELEQYLMKQETDIHVLALRHEYRPDSGDVEGDEPEDAGVRWTHRWIVRPHWKWQWHGGKDRENDRCEHCGKTGGFHRRILIAPFVKGPEHLPLLEKNRVDSLIR